MGGFVKTGNVARDAASYAAEQTRQGAVGQVTVNAAEIVYCRTIIASCKASSNGVGAEAYQSELRLLGTGGTRDV